MKKPLLPSQQKRMDSFCSTLDLFVTLFMLNEVTSSRHRKRMDSFCSTLDLFVTLFMLNEVTSSRHRKRMDSFCSTLDLFVTLHKMSGLYIHIPFCKKRCAYCGFYSTTHAELRQQYVDAVCHEMSLRKGGHLNTIYLGGGTPSQLDISMLSQLFATIHQCYDVADDAEITMECNPDDIMPLYVSWLTQLPINRISIGIQTFSDPMLRFLHRRHTSSQAKESVRLFREHGFNNISIDLMFGFPQETLSQWQYDIGEALKLGVEHISAYSLMIEEGTPLYRLYEKGELKETDEESYLLMYNTLVDQLTASGYEHYEISNFALPGRHSRHNSSYWSHVPYIGIGASAHSYDLSTRSWNVSDIHEYIRSIDSGILPSETEVLTPTDHYNDLITTSLRTSSGIDLQTLEQRFGTTFKQFLLVNADRGLSRGWLQLTADHLRLTRSGIPISDMVMSDLIMIEE